MRLCEIFRLCVKKINTTSANNYYFQLQHKPIDKLLNIGRSMFALGVTALGILCFTNKDFIIGRPPVWDFSYPINPTLAYVSGTAIIISGIAILIHKKGNLAAWLIAILILLLSVSRHILHFMDDWLNTYKSIALFGSALIVAATYNIHGKMSNWLIWMGTIMLSVFFIACGYSHFKFYDFVKEFIPAYLPMHGFFAIFAAICLLAGGIGILIPATRKWAALLSGIMVGGWFLLLHIPRFLANTNDASDRMGVCESFAFAGIFFVLAAIFDKVDKKSKTTTYSRL